MNDYEKYLLGDDDEDHNLPNYCPNCQVPYDDIDFEYQICSNCGFNNNLTEDEVE